MRESIDGITAELRKGSRYLRELADRIDAAHIDGVLKAIDELMQGREPIPTTKPQRRRR